MIRANTQSNPFSLGDRAHPGAPMTGLPSISPTTSKLPGSTGMPTLSTAPPACLMAAGITSSASVTAEAPKMMIISLAGAISASALASAAVSCGLSSDAVISDP